MLSFQDFFAACTGQWTTERIYHYMPDGEIERSFTDFRVQGLTQGEKEAVLATVNLSHPAANPTELAAGPTFALDWQQVTLEQLPGFAIAFDTRSETGETVSMSLKALFIAEAWVLAGPERPPMPVMPPAAQVPYQSDIELIRGFYLRDEGYSEQGAIAGYFTYQPTRQTLEMTTYYRRSVAVDQMRFLAPNLRARTIVTYQRPSGDELPTAIRLIGFGVEQRQP